MNIFYVQATPEYPGKQAEQSLLYRFVGHIQEPPIDVISFILTTPPFLQFGVYEQSLPERPDRHVVQLVDISASGIAHVCAGN